MTNQANHQNQASKTVYFMGGCAGAGKSYQRKRIEELASLRVIDSDSHKESHPDYDPNHPELLHKWSSEQARAEFSEALTESDSFIYDGTCVNAAKYSRMIEEARVAGFQTKIVYVKVSRETSFARQELRDRKVPAHVINEQHDKIESSMDELKTRVDEFTTISGEG